VIPTEEAGLDKIPVFRQYKRSVQDTNVILREGAAARKKRKTITRSSRLVLTLFGNVRWVVGFLNQGYKIN
jgi:hypothetical protein